MPRFDLAVEFPDHTGKRVRFHTIGDAADLESLPTAVAASLGARITQLCGVVSEGAGSPEDEKKYADMITALERSHGKVDHATKNQMRKALGLMPISKKQAADDDEKPSASKPATSPQASGAK